jgi:hypothetical protein
MRDYMVGRSAGRGFSGGKEAKYGDLRLFEVCGRRPAHNEEGTLTLTLSLTRQGRGENKAKRGDELRSAVTAGGAFDLTGHGADG